MESQSSDQMDEQYAKVNERLEKVAKMLGELSKVKTMKEFSGVYMKNMGELTEGLSRFSRAFFLPLKTVLEDIFIASGTTSGTTSGSSSGFVSDFEPVEIYEAFGAPESPLKQLTWISPSWSKSWTL
jgi:hypothetical protein